MGEEPSGQLATMPSGGASAKQVPASQKQQPEIEDDDFDLDFDISDEEADEMLASMGNVNLTDTVIEEKRSAYWSNVSSNVLTSIREGDSALGHNDPIAIVAQVVFDSMRDVSRQIGTQVAIGKYGFGGSEEETPSSEESAWKPILTNNVNVNDEVLYKIGKKRSTADFWLPKTYTFINQFLTGPAGSLSGATKIFSNIVEEGLVASQKMFGEDLTKENFLEMVCFVVSNNIERYANTRNAPQDAVSYVEKSVDRAFGTIIKRGTQDTNPLYFKDRRVFISRRPDPTETIEIAGKEKQLRQAFIDAIIAEVAIESVEYSIFKKLLISKDADQKKREAGINKISDELKTSETLTFISGKGSKRKTFQIKVSEFLEKASSYIDTQFESIPEETIDDPEEETADDIEDIAVVRDSKSMDSAIAVVLDLYKADKATPASAVARDYVTFIINRKLKATGDEELADDSSAMAMFSVIDDSVLTLSDPLISILEDYIDEQKSVFETSEDPQVAKRIITAANAIQDISALIEISDETGDTFGEIEYREPDTGEEKSTAGGDILNKTPGGAILKYIYGNVFSDVFRGGKGGSFGAQIDSNKKINDLYKKYEKEMQAEVEALYKAEGVSLKDAQASAYETAKQIGLKERSATFMKGSKVEPKASWVYQERVSKLPNFKASSPEELNPITKNLVCWYSAIANKQSGGEASISQKIQIAEEIYKELSNHANEWFDLNVYENFSRKGEFRKYVIDTVKAIVSNTKALASITSDAIDDYVKLTELTPEKIKEMIK